MTTAPVDPGDLSVQVVSDLGMSVAASPAHPLVSTATVTAHNVLHSRHQVKGWDELHPSHQRWLKRSSFPHFLCFQEASVNVWLQFSDDTASLLSSFSGLPYFLRLSSLAETVVVVPPGQSQLVYAQGDGGGPLLLAELLVSVCNDRRVASSSVHRGDGMESKGTSVLAKGSGWIRVNLERGFLPKAVESSEFEADISDILVGSNADLDVSNANRFRHRNVSSDYKIRRQSHDWNKVTLGKTEVGNHLERAVQMPGKEEGAVYFSSSQEKKQDWAEEQLQQEDAVDLEVGVGVVLSLLGIFALLFLANCLPSTLRARMSSEQERGEAQPAARESEEENKTEDEEERRQEDGDEDVKVEIVC